MPNEKKQKEQYKKMVEMASPKASLMKNCTWAFFVGGLICTIGQVINNVIINMGTSEDEAATFTAIILVFLGALLTGLDIYDSIGKKAGAGSIVPITGFANSIVSPAIEFKKEGYVFGVGAKIFTIAGPVILYGIISSVVVGLFYYILSYL